MKPAIFELPPGSQLKFSPLSSNETKLPSYVFLGSGGDKQRCTAGSSFSAGEKANLQIPLGQWKVGKGIANGLCFLLTQTALLQSMLTLFFCQKVQGQCKGGIFKDRIILGRAGSGWVQKTGWTKLSRLTFLQQAARFRLFEKQSCADAWHTRYVFDKWVYCLRPSVWKLMATSRCWKTKLYPSQSVLRSLVESHFGQVVATCSKWPRSTLTQTSWQVGISAHFKIGRLKSSSFFAGASLKTGAWIQNYGQGVAGKALQYWQRL